MQKRLLLGALVLISAACSRSTGTLEITDSWAATTPPNAQAAVVYLTIDNASGTDDRLVDVTTDRCSTVELHATQFDENRVMRMRLAEPELLEIPAGETMEMVPGGLHVMCIGPTAPFVKGETIDMTVTLEQAGSLAITTPIENR